MKKTPSPRMARSRNTALQLNTILKRLEESMDAQRLQRKEIQDLKDEIEALRREITMTMESLAELPYVSGMVH